MRALYIKQCLAIQVPHILFSNAEGNTSEGEENGDGGKKEQARADKLYTVKFADDCCVYDSLFPATRSLKRDRVKMQISLFRVVSTTSFCGCDENSTKLVLSVSLNVKAQRVSCQKYGVIRAQNMLNIYI